MMICLWIPFDPKITAPSFEGRDWANKAKTNHDNVGDKNIPKILHFSLDQIR